MTMNKPTTTPPATAEPELTQLTHLRLDQIKQGINPRTEFDREKLSELAQTIKATGGLIQPVVVYLDGDGQYGLIAGERRWRAAKEAGFEQIDAIVREKPPAHTARKLALVENIQRENLTPLEIAWAIRDMLAESTPEGLPIYNQAQLADELGKGPQFISLCEALLRCGEGLQLKVHHGRVPLEIAAMIGALPADMHEMAEADIVRRPNGCMTRDEARKHIAEKYRRDLRKAQFDKGVENLVPETPACHYQANGETASRCPFNGAGRGDMTGKGRANVCLNPACFDRKQQAHVKLVLDAESDGHGVQVLGQEMRDKVFSFDGVTVKGDSGYVAADEKPDKDFLANTNADVGTWEDVIKGQEVKPVKILDAEGRVRTLYDAKVALTAARASKAGGSFKSATGSAGASRTPTDNGKSAEAEKRKAKAVIATGQVWVKKIYDCPPETPMRKELCRLIMERLTEAADREWMTKVLGVRQVMDYPNNESILALALVARQLRLQGPAMIGGSTGALCKLIKFDPKAEARAVEAAAVGKEGEKKGGGPHAANPEAEGKAWRAYLKTGSIAKAVAVCGLDKGTVQNWHKRRGWKARREAEMRK